jgi:hypothetical protein
MNMSNNLFCGRIEDRECFRYDRGKKLIINEEFSDEI